jgi:hypothetical protein
VHAEGSGRLREVRQNHKHKERDEYSLNVESLHRSGYPSADCGQKMKDET